MEVEDNVKEIRTGVNDIQTSGVTPNRTNKYIINVDVRSVYAFVGNKDKTYQIRLACGSNVTNSAKLVKSKE